MAINSSPKVSIICACYQGEKYLSQFLDNLSKQTILPKIELVLDHNEPSEIELLAVTEFNRQYPGVISQQIINPVTPISVSMNNCVAHAKGDYLCLWNIDDHRTPDSLELMCNTLDNDPSIGFTFGDYIVVDGLGKRQGRYWKRDEYNRKRFTKAMMLGPFFMWRANLIPEIGFFDEQFFSAADFDFAIRLSAWCKGKKTKGLLGYYLNIGQGVSTGTSHLKRNIQHIERNVVNLRYGVYENVDPEFVSEAKKYDVDHYRFFGRTAAISEYFPDYSGLISKRQKFRKFIWIVKSTRKIRRIWKKIFQLFIRKTAKLKKVFVKR